MCGSVHMSAGIHGGQKKVSDLLELELQVIVRHLTWVLGTELSQTSAKVGRDPNH